MGGIGNCILLSPALRGFCAAYPESRISFLLPPNGSRQIIEKHPQTDVIIETAPSFNRFILLVNALRKLKPDLVIAANGTNPLKAGLLGLFSGSRYRLGESFGAGKWLYNLRIPFEPRCHEAVANNNLIRLLTSEEITLTPEIWTTEGDKIAANAFIGRNNLAGPWIGIHPGSGPSMSYKRWPTERFIDTARQLLNIYRCKIVIFGGPDEKTSALKIARQIGEAARIAAGELSIRQSFELLKNCTLFISNDSGPMHLAAAAGAPVIALFGPTMEYKTSPLGKVAIITSKVGCRPCYSYKPIYCSSLECMAQITVKKVIDAAHTILSKASVS